MSGVLNGRFTRMGQLIKTDVLQKAGGADERAAAEKLAQDPTSNAVTLDGDTMVTRTSLG